METDNTIMVFANEMLFTNDPVLKTGARATILKEQEQRAKGECAKPGCPKPAEPHFNGLCRGKKKELSPPNIVFEKKPSPEPNQESVRDLLVANSQVMSPPKKMASYCDIDGTST